MKNKKYIIIFLIITGIIAFLILNLLSDKSNEVINKAGVNDQSNQCKVKNIVINAEKDKDLILNFLNTGKMETVFKGQLSYSWNTFFDSQCNYLLFSLYSYEPYDGMERADVWYIYSIKSGKYLEINDPYAKWVGDKIYTPEYISEYSSNNNPLTTKEKYINMDEVEKAIKLGKKSI